MSYTPTNWQTGDTITAQLLNKMEQGIASAGGGGGVLIATDTGGTLDKTWQEIFDARFAVLCKEDSDSLFDTAFLTRAEAYGGEYDVYFVSFSDPTAPVIVTYATASADGYPELSDGGGGN